MSSQQDADACGAHSIGEAIPNSRFDYTCDDCMLPANWLDYDQDPEYKKHYDSQGNKKGSGQVETDAETVRRLQSGGDNVF